MGGRNGLDHRSGAGLSAASLDKTNVLIWWGHQRHGEVTDEHVKRIVDRVKNGGMGFIALHSAHYSKALKALLGTNCGWKGGYVEDGSKLELIVKDKQHPIAAGVSDFSIPHTERYTEPFEIPEPESVVLRRRLHPARRQQGIVAAGYRLDGWQGPGILLPAWPRNVSDFLRCQDPQGPLQRRGMGRRNKVEPLAFPHLETGSSNQL